MELIEKLNSDEFKLYEKCIDNIDRVIIKDGFIIFPEIKKKIKPPVLKNVFEKIDELKQSRTELLLKYRNIQDKMFYTVGNKTEYNKIIKDVAELDNLIEELQEYYEKVNEEIPHTKLDKHVLDLNRTYKLLKSKTHYDKKTIKDYISKLKKKEDLIEDYAPQKIIDYFVVEQPVIMDLTEEYVMPKKITKKPTQLNKGQAELIKDRIKELLEEKFKFKNKEECMSARRSMPYYTSKENLIKTIEVDDTLRSIMPKNYKSLNKEKICEQLFF